MDATRGGEYLFKSPLRQTLCWLVAASALAVGAVAIASAAGAAPNPRVVAVFQSVTGSGGYSLYSNDMLNAQLGAPFFGDARKSGLNNFTALAQSSFCGYWLINSAGRFFQYGQACLIRKIVAPSKIVGPIIGAISY